MAGVGTIFNPVTMFGLLIMIVLTSLAFNTMMFLLMVRIEDPLVPRAMFGILNTLLFFPSGSVYPIQAFPPWLRVIAKCDPFTYAVDGFKCLLLKETTLSAVWGDMLFLSIFAASHAGDRDPAVQANAVGVERLSNLAIERSENPLANRPITQSPNSSDSSQFRELLTCPRVRYAREV